MPATSPKTVKALPAIPSERVRDSDPGQELSDWAGAVAIIAVKPTKGISVSRNTKSNPQNARRCVRQFNRCRSLKGMVEVIVVLLPAVASIAWLNRASNKQTVCQPRQAVGAGMEWGGDAGRYQTGRRSSFRHC